MRSFVPDGERQVEGQRGDCDVEPEGNGRRPIESEVPDEKPVHCDEQEDGRPGGLTRCGHRRVDSGSVGTREGPSAGEPRTDKITHSKELRQFLSTGLPTPGRLRQPLAPALVCAATLLFQWPFFDRFFSAMDEGHMLYYAELVANGGHLYRDATIYPLPGAFYLLALIFEVFEPSGG